MVVFTVIFGRLAKMPTEGDAPYALMVFAGMLPWHFFSRAVRPRNSLIGNANLISKVYFPRLIVPTAAVVVVLVDFLISFTILVLVMLWYQFLPSWQISYPAVLRPDGLPASLGPGLWITALNVKYRDFRYVIPFIVTWALYVARWLQLQRRPRAVAAAYSLNPVVGVIDGFRWAILGDEANLSLPGFLLSWCTIAFFLWLGVRKFRKWKTASPILFKAHSND